MFSTIPRTGICVLRQNVNSRRTSPVETFLASKYKQQLSQTGNYMKREMQVLHK